MEQTNGQLILNQTKNRPTASSTTSSSSFRAFKQPDKMLMETIKQNQQPKTEEKKNKYVLVTAYKLSRT